MKIPKLPANTNKNLTKVLDRLERKLNPKLKYKKRNPYGRCYKEKRGVL